MPDIITIQDLHDLIDARLPDNEEKLIHPEHVREVLHEMLQFSAGLKVAPNMLFISEDFGNDDTAEKGSLFNMFQTLEAAYEAAVDGDIIRLMPGSYSADWDSANLYKQGVSYFAEPGASISKTTDGAMFTGFNQSGDSYFPAPRHLTIQGYGKWVHEGNDPVIEMLRGTQMSYLQFNTLHSTGAEAIREPHEGHYHVDGNLVESNAGEAISIKTGSLVISDRTRVRSTAASAIKVEDMDNCQINAREVETTTSQAALHIIGGSNVSVRSSIIGSNALQIKSVTGSNVIVNANIAGSVSTYGSGSDNTRYGNVILFLNIAPGNPINLTFNAGNIELFGNWANHSISIGSAAAHARVNMYASNVAATQAGGNITIDHPLSVLRLDGNHANAGTITVNEGKVFIEDWECAANGTSVINGGKVTLTGTYVNLGAATLTHCFLQNGGIFRVYGDIRLLDTTNAGSCIRKMGGTLILKGATLYAAHPNSKSISVPVGEQEVIVLEKCFTNRDTFGNIDWTVGSPNDLKVDDEVL